MFLTPNISAQAEEPQTYVEVVKINHNVYTNMY